MSYRNVCWGRGDDDVMEAVGGPAHSGCYLSRWLQRHNSGKNLTIVTTTTNTTAVLLQLQPLLYYSTCQLEVSFIYLMILLLQLVVLLLMLPILLLLVLL